jgi:hypothetical protein
MSIDFAALVARATVAASASHNLVPVKRSRETGRMVATTVATTGKVQPIAPVAKAAPVVTRETAERFIMAHRAAAKVKGAERDAAERDAVIAFTGRWQAAAYHAKQVNDAMALASRTIVNAKRGPVAPAAVKVAPTLAGYVAGVNDAAKRDAEDTAARRRLAVGLLCDLRKVTTREGLHAALVSGGHDDAKFAPFLANDAEAIEAAKLLAAKLAAEHGIDLNA